MTTDLSPVTETEMRTFAERMVSSFVSLSDQARQLTELQAEMNTIKQDMDYQRSRLEAVLNENASLQSQIQTLVAERDNARREAADNLALAKQFENDHERVKYTVDHLQNRLNHSREENENLQSQAVTLRNELADTNSKLTHATTKLTKLQEHFRSVFEEAQEAAGNSGPSHWPSVQAAVQQPEPPTGPYPGPYGNTSEVKF